jgi:hypothetical protein
MWSKRDEHVVVTFLVYEMGLADRASPQELTALSWN